jgi:hypothetical protein
MNATTRSTVSSDQRWPATARSQAQPLGEAAGMKLALPGLALAHEEGIPLLESRERTFFLTLD